MNFNKTKTYQNLARAYAGECQARTRYEFIEYGARYNNYKNIADVIDEIIYQEFNHARMFYTFLQKGENKQIDNIEINAGYPFREKWDLQENLKLASIDEDNESILYDEFAKTAEKEGYPEIAKLFLDVKAVEEYHREIFKEMYTQMKNKTLYKKDAIVTWICADCGYTATSNQAWDECPLCKAKQGSIKLILESKILNT